MAPDPEMFQARCGAGFGHLLEWPLTPAGSAQTLMAIFVYGLALEN